ncbi:MAG: hypothetical protein ACPG6B_03880 [Oceanihabitans sp.]
MKRIVYFLTLIFIFCLTTSNSTTSKAKGEKVTICHIPPGNPENSHEITVSVNAISAHLAHGDLLGGCNEY